MSHGDLFEEFTDTPEKQAKRISVLQEMHGLSPEQARLVDDEVSKLAISMLQSINRRFKEFVEEEPHEKHGGACLHVPFLEHMFMMLDAIANNHLEEFARLRLSVDPLAALFHLLTKTTDVKVVTLGDLLEEELGKSDTGKHGPH